MLEIVFEEARSGLAQITVFEASGLRNIDPMGQQDPYVQFSLGKSYKKRTKAIKGGGVEPVFHEEDVLLWLDQDNWVDDLLVQVLDEDAKEEKPIGSTQFSLLPYMKNTLHAAQEEAYDLFYYIKSDGKDEEKKEVACGQIVLRVRCCVCCFRFYCLMLKITALLLYETRFASSLPADWECFAIALRDSSSPKTQASVQILATTLLCSSHWTGRPCRS
jgi:hypothetical protein